MLSTLPGAGAGETKDEVGLETESAPRKLASLSRTSRAVGLGGGDRASGASAYSPHKFLP